MRKLSSNYNLLSNFQFLVHIVVFMLCAILVIAPAVFTLLYINKTYDNPKWAFIVFLVILIISKTFLVGLALKILKPILNKLDILVSLARPSPFINKYGKDFKKPTFEQFDLMPEQYYKFNGASRIDYIFPILCVWVLAFYTSFQVAEDKKWKMICLIMILAIAVSSMIIRLINRINLQMDQKRPHYDKIKKYNEAVNIYERIADEIRKL